LRDWSDVGEVGVTGDAMLATAEKGREIVGRAMKKKSFSIGALHTFSTQDLNAGLVAYEAL
jgi:creatinine amidohydrolase/Fe(II)-dependent formamide hydrolase-like protein